METWAGDQAANTSLWGTLHVPIIEWKLVLERAHEAALCKLHAWEGGCGLLETNLYTWNTKICMSLWTRDNETFLSMWASMFLSFELQKRKKKIISRPLFWVEKWREEWRHFNFRWCQATVPAALAAAVTLNQTNNPSTSNTETLDCSALQFPVDTSKPGDCRCLGGVFPLQQTQAKASKRGASPLKGEWGHKVGEDGLKSEPETYWLSISQMLSTQL